MRSPDASEGRAEPVRLPRRRWVEMSTLEFGALPHDTVAVLPVAAVEQHGPHLPVGVDALLVQAVVDRAVPRLPADLPVTVLPSLPIGKSDEHLAFAGTLSLGAGTLIRLWTEVGECVYRAGVRKLVLLNSHGGQPQVMDIVARDLRVRLGMFVVCASTYGLGAVPGLFSAEEERHGIHGGESETSQMLALRPDLVAMQHARHFVSAGVALEAEYEWLRPEGQAVGFGWQTQDLHPDGACGNARAADPERGRVVLDTAADALVRLLAEVHRFPLSRVVSRDPVPHGVAP
ncbi:MAG: creatininase family protein [Ideonella sp.]|jgi:creatinine amidohydrolase|nr:creatininase family protein [Ideonella sp.]